MRSVELFSGIGGLALGISQAGFIHDAIIEKDKPTCKTLFENRQRDAQLLKNWNVFEHDVRNFDYSIISEHIDLVAGGPPCQPFSMGGKHRGYTDERDMFPEAIRAVRELQPRVFMFENVKGLLRPSFAQYFRYIQLQLTHPNLMQAAGENWLDHLSRLEKHSTSSINKDLHYHLMYRLLNAADYGVPQRRERVFIIGFRSDLGIEWSFPTPTHSQDMLTYQQYVTGHYWERHNLHHPSNGTTNSARQQQLDESTLWLKPWLTVRDAISDLPDPESFLLTEVPNHEYRAGAKIYKGHTGSRLDEPAKTLKAGDHGVPGGENMLVKTSGEVRYFTVRESARLQGFPDTYLFPASWTESMRQLGNAVPVSLAYILAKSIMKSLQG